MPFVAFFSRYFTVLLFSALFLSYSRDLSDFCGCNCPSLLTVLQLTALPPTVSMTSPLNHHSNTDDINVNALSLGNGDGSEETLFTFSSPNDLFKNLLKYCTTVLNHPVRLNYCIRCYINLSLSGNRSLVSVGCVFRIILFYEIFYCILFLFLSDISFTNHHQFPRHAFS
jgi:hypothetical protein